MPGIVIPAGFLAQYVLATFCVLAGCEATRPAGSPSPPSPSTLQSLDERLLFHPAKHPAGNWRPRGLRFEDVSFTAADGTRLHGWYCPAAEPRAVLLFCHGNAGNVTNWAPIVRTLQQDLGLTTLLFDYRGYGKSEGVPNVEGILQDARAARTLLAKTAGVEETDVVLMGRSLGGAVAIQLAADTPPRGLIVESTFSSLRDAARHHFPKLAFLVPEDRLNSVAKIASYTGPFLQSHGDADGTIPFALGRKLFEAANEPKRLVTIRGGDHNDPPSAEYYRELEEFIRALPDE